MSRVDQIPTYQHQAFCALAVQTVLGEDEALFKKLLGTWSNRDRQDWLFSYAEVLQGALCQPHEPMSMEDFDEYGIGWENWKWLSREAGEKIASRLPGRIALSEAICKALSEVMRIHGVEEVYSDFEARSRIIYELITDPGLTQRHNQAADSYAINLTREALIAQTPYLKLTATSFINAVNLADFGQSQDPDLVNGLRIAEATEALFLSSHCKLNYAAHKFHMSEQVDAIDAQMVEDASMSHRFSLDQSRAEKYMIGYHLYKFLGVWVIIHKKSHVMYIVDRASLDQIRLRAWSVFGFWVYAKNYRLIGMGTGRLHRNLFLSAAIKCYDWLKTALRTVHRSNNHPQWLAKYMKIHQSALINELAREHEPVDYRQATHTTDLLREAEETLPGLDGWYQLLRSLNIPEQWQLDLSYLFHLLPSPDCAPALLFSETIKRLKSEHTPNADTARDFMNYVKSNHVMEVCAKTKGNFEYKCVDGYDPTEEPWWKACVKGERRPAPREEWGKVWVYRHFPYTKKMENWHLSAGDTTHVNGCLAEYVVPRDQTTQSRMEANEILYVLLHGNKLSKKYDPSAYRDLICQGQSPLDNIALLAAKAENTKAGPKVRETYSAMDAFREFQSEIDHNGQHMNNVIEGPVLRTSQYSQNKKMHHLAKYQVQSERLGQCTIFTSQDVSSWSPRMNRRFAIEFYQYIIETTAFPEGLRIATMWDRITVVIDKRGHRAFAHTYTGNFMGFPGTMDTGLHSMICAYVIRRAKDKRILGPMDSGDVMTTIDDAVLRLTLRGSPKEPKTRARAANFLAFMGRVYHQLGFEVDDVKTIISSVKFTYLNRVFVLGSEALTPMKIFMKINRELHLRFTSVFTQMSSIFNSSYGAAERGADPLLSYMFSMFLAIRWAYISSPKVADERHSSHWPQLTVLAPRTIGGWGNPHLVAWLTKEACDPLSEFCALASALYRALSAGARLNGGVFAQKAADSVTVYMTKMLSQEFSQTTGYQVALAPRAIRFKGVRDPEGAAKERFMEAARKLVADPTIKAIISLETEERIRDAVNALMACSCLDVAVVEAVMSSFPTQLFQSIIDKAQKSEVVVIAMSLAVRMRLATAIKRLDCQQLVHMARVQIRQQTAWAYHWNPHDSGTNVAYQVRTVYYQFAGVRLLNHTAPAALESLVHTDPKFYPTKIGLCHVTCSEISPPHLCAAGLGNLYDGRTPARTSVGVKTRGAINLNSPSMRISDPAVKILVKAAAVMKWLEAHGVNTDPLWSLILRSWTVDDSLEWLSIPVKMDVFASSKRLSSAICNSFHPIAAFPNCQAAIEMDLAPLGQLLDRRSSRHDYAAILTAMRASALIDLACMGVPFAPRVYAISHNAILWSDDDAMSVTDSEELWNAVNAIVPLFSHDKGLADRVTTTLASLAKMTQDMQADKEGDDDMDTMDEVVPRVRIAMTEAQQDAFSFYSTHVWGVGTLAAVLRQNPHVAADTPGMQTRKGSAESAGADTSSPREKRGVKLERQVEQNRNKFGSIMGILATIASAYKVAFPKSKTGEMERNRPRDIEAFEFLCKTYSADDVESKAVRCMGVARSVLRMNTVFDKEVRDIVKSEWGNMAYDALYSGKDHFKFTATFTILKYAQGHGVGPLSYVARGLTSTSRAFEDWRASMNRYMSRRNAEVSGSAQWVLYNTWVTLYQCILVVDVEQASGRELVHAWSRGAMTSRDHACVTSDWRYVAVQVAPLDVGHPDARSTANAADWLAHVGASWPTQVRGLRCWKEACLTMWDHLIAGPLMLTPALPPVEEEEVLADDVFPPVAADEEGWNPFGDDEISVEIATAPRVDPRAGACTLLAVGIHQVDDAFARMGLIRGIRSGQIEPNSVLQHHHGWENVVRSPQYEGQYLAELGVLPMTSNLPRADMGQ